jgi:hypothetical protein
MNENDYLQQVANLAGLRHYPQQGPWSKKSGSAVGTRDNYVTAIGFSHNGQGANLVILLRFKKLEQSELVKAALKSAAIKKGKLGAVGSGQAGRGSANGNQARDDGVRRALRAMRFDIHAVAHAAERDAHVYLRDLPGKSPP